MTVFLKFVHLAAIAVWSGGLLVLPFLFWQRATLAVAYVSADARHANTVVSKAMDFIEDNVEGQVLETFVEIL